MKAKPILLALLTVLVLSCTEKKDAPVELVMETTMGNIELRLYDETPLHRDNFESLAREGAFDSLLFHRVIKDFMIQGGDPDSKYAPSGVMLGEGDRPYTVPAEFRLEDGIYHKRGVLAAARENDDVNPEQASSAMQFYIVWGRVFDDDGIAKIQERLDQRTGGKVKLTPEMIETYKTLGGTPHLDGQYTVFGEVTKGLEVVDAIQNVSRDENDRPLKDVRILRVYVKSDKLEQDGSDLWFANSRSYNDVLGSVETVISSELDEEEYNVYDADGKRIVAGGSEKGVMYGVYALQRAEVLGQADAGINIQSKPAYEYRILNHWDNMDDSVERGYAGLSMWEWTEQDIPAWRIHKYGQLCASVGINGSVLNNVNSNPVVLDAEHISRISKIADILRQYGVKTYISIKWTSPMALDGVKTGDPLDPTVRQWWKDKADEIYAAIPDFGGFLVKANSEGQEGPQDHGRTHADGANMLAEALAPHGGIVMWRAFVYNPTSPDRANQAVEEFEPLDGEFLDNVIIQVKNGPIDFQPREPFSPLFGRMPNTKLMLEFQITQEYLGFSNHLTYHGTTYKECLDSDTYANGEGSTVAKMVTGIAGVANTGQARNFSGYIFAQSNWYVFGRLAWDPELGAEEIADEWIRQTFNKPAGMSAKAFDKKFVKPVKAMMMESREAVVNYEMPVGLHHLFMGTHYGPGPWDKLARPDWCPSYYHKAAVDGIGFDRTIAGSGNTQQYHEPLASEYENVETCPENLLLWFHHLPWDYRMSSGRTVWDEICLHYDTGISQVEGFQKTWDALKPYVSEAIFEEVADKLEKQHNDAEWWRDACVGYFQQCSNMELPDGVRPLNMPIDELCSKTLVSDKNGMPVYGDDNRVVLE